MKRILIWIMFITVLLLSSYMTFVYYVPVSQGIRSGELIKLSRKGIFVKTWEGELSQGISGAQIFKFSVYDSNKNVIEKLQKFQGGYVKMTYIEKYRTFFWWGQTRYFIKDVEKENSPFTPVNTENKVNTQTDIQIKD